jgi:hypothetical protein
MSDKVHWVIPGAALALEARPQASASTTSLPLPNLRRLLSAMTPAARLELPEDSPALPFEMLLARLNGLPAEPGHVPWAAFEHRIAGTPCAVLRLCHWQVGTDNVMLSPPDALGLSADDAQSLLAAMSPYFEEDGIKLATLPGAPGTWLVTGQPLRDLATISLDRAIGKRLTRSFFEAKGPSAALIRKLQNEMQMLLYTSPVNDQRELRGLLPVNSFWVTGAGVLSEIIQPVTGIQIEARLQEPAQRQDSAAHAQAWQAVDADLCVRLLAQVQAGNHVTLSLCAERAAQTFEPAAQGAWQRLKRAFATTDEHKILDTL